MSRPHSSFMLFAMLVQSALSTCLYRWSSITTGHTIVVSFDVDTGSLLTEARLIGYFLRSIPCSVDNRSVYGFFSVYNSPNAIISPAILIAQSNETSICDNTLRMQYRGYYDSTNISAALASEINTVSQCVANNLSQLPCRFEVRNTMGATILYLFIGVVATLLLAIGWVYRADKACVTALGKAYNRYQQFKSERINQAEQEKKITIDESIKLLNTPINTNYTL